MSSCSLSTEVLVFIIFAGHKAGLINILCAARGIYVVCSLSCSVFSCLLLVHFSVFLPCPLLYAFLRRSVIIFRASGAAKRARHPHKGTRICCARERTRLLSARSLRRTRHKTQRRRRALFIFCFILSYLFFLFSTFFTLYIASAFASYRGI